MTQEKDLENQFLDWLNQQPDTFAFKVQTTGVYDPVTKAFRKPGRFVLKGTSDIIGLIHGIFFAIEVKVPGKNATTEQKGFINKVNKTGGYAIVASELAHVENFLNELRFILDGVQ